jgi:riboflavin-specific deaminase-like protein
MRALLPDEAEVDPWEAYRPPAEDHVRINMVASADGAIVDAEGRSGSIGGDGDRTMRALSDVIVVGAGTVREEGYGPHRPPARLAERRRAEGRPEAAAIAVVSASLDLDPSARLFADAAVRTVVLTAGSADAARRRALDEVADVIVAGEESVDPATALAALRDRGHRRVLVEGGPTLNAAWLAAGVVDELCLTIAPLLLGEGGPRLAGDLADRVELDLDGVLAQGGELLLRYHVKRA